MTPIGYTKLRTHLLNNEGISSDEMEHLLSIAYAEVRHGKI